MSQTSDGLACVFAPDALKLRGRQVEIETQADGRMVLRQRDRTRGI
jgi:hypothetical protein